MTQYVVHSSEEMPDNISAFFINEESPSAAAHAYGKYLYQKPGGFLPSVEVFTRKQWEALLDGLDRLQERLVTDRFLQSMTFPSSS